MPRDYNLKNDPFDSNRIKKTIKQQLNDAAADRKLARDTYEFFMNIVKESPDNQMASQLVGECLKLMQTSKTSITKFLAEAVKLEIANLKEKGSGDGFDFENLND